MLSIVLQMRWTQYHINSLLPFNVYQNIHTDDAQYVSLQIKIRWRKVNICWLGSGKWFFSCIFAEFAEADKKRSKNMRLLEKSVINMI